MGNESGSRECGIGLSGRIDMLVKWLSDEYDILTDHKTVEHWLKQPLREGSDV